MILPIQVLTSVLHSLYYSVSAYNSLLPYLYRCIVEHGLDGILSTCVIKGDFLGWLIGML